MTQVPELIPYAKPWLDDDDIAAVLEVLHSDWLTTGPRVEAFEQAFATYVNSSFAVAVSSGTAALHAALAALELGPGDEVIAPALTFVATTNAVVFQGATPVFADVRPQDLLLDPEQVAARITPRTKAIIAVDYTGQPCDYDALQELASRHGLALLADACHSLGGRYRGRPVGTLADLSTFSFHPAKHLTTGEGGMVTTERPELAARLRRFRNHGIDMDLRERTARGTYYYEMVELGYNYRLTDLQCALGLSQLRKLPGWLARRREIASRYQEAFADLPGVRWPVTRPEVEHAYHLFVLLLDPRDCPVTRDEAFQRLRALGIGANVHYLPVHLHPFYRRRFGTGPGLCPVAEAAYEQLLTLPLYPALSDAAVERIIAAVRQVVQGRAALAAGP